MNITVIVCTYNRCEMLAEALSSLAVSTLPSSVTWEVLVVDNNSTDRTRAVVEGFCERYPERFRYLFEARSGKSYALNTGIRHALGEILAFLDDDVVAEPAWLEKLTANLDDNNWAGAGGRILANWTSPRPSWIWLDGRYSLAPLAIFDLGPTSGELREAPFGTNMAFRKAIFDKYGDFRTDLGPRPGSQIRGEDSEFAERLFAAGERLRYESSAVVYHSLPKNRLRKAYFLEWWFDKGRTEMRLSGPRPGTKRFFLGIPCYLFRNLAAGVLRWTLALNAARRFNERTGIWCKAGQIFECYQMRQSQSLSPVNKKKLTYPLS